MKLRARLLILGILLSACGAVTAAAGEPVKPLGRSFPEFFDGKLEPMQHSGLPTGAAFWNSYMYGRVFYPDLGQFRVEMVDANNNFIGTFGKYGNQDSGGPNATVKKPEIPLAWPLTVAVSDTHAYVADTVSRRVARVKLDYAATETCEIK
jgi:hypothetical protein